MNPAITRLIHGPRDKASITAFFSQNTFPLVENDGITFVWRGEASEVLLKHWVFGLQSSQRLARIEGTDVWYLSMPIPPGSRVEYKFEVIRNGHGHWIHDPLNKRLARDPFGANSVAQGTGYMVPSWIEHAPGVAKGRYETIDFTSQVFGTQKVKVYLPARFRTSRKYSLLIVHDGDDYLNYAALGPVLDNLMAWREIPDLIVAFTNSAHRIVEYANDERHARFLTDELVPHMEREFPIRSQPQSRCLMGASFGAVASLSTAWRRPGFYGKLLLQSGSFAFSDIGERNQRGPAFDPVVKFMNQFREVPTAVSERVFVSCGTYESLIYENRSLIPLLEATGMDVRFREARDGHNWENWRDRLREGLSWLFPGPFLMMYE
jgi:enterochelin esterase family protein